MARLAYTSPASRARAMAAVRLATPSLAKILLVCVLTVLMAIIKALEISAFDLPIATSRSTSSSRLLSGSMPGAWGCTGSEDGPFAAPSA